MTSKTVLANKEKTGPDIEEERTKPVDVKEMRLNVENERVRPTNVERTRPDIEGERIRPASAEEMTMAKKLIVIY